MAKVWSATARVHILSFSASLRASAPPPHPPPPLPSPPPSAEVQNAQNALIQNIPICSWKDSEKTRTPVNVPYSAKEKIQNFLVSACHFYPLLIPLSHLDDSERQLLTEYLKANKVCTTECMRSAISRM